ncbi:HtaA domain-containing protein [Microbacterium sp. SORGH_AS_0862]|uniref:HtaA domain-containing protein n=1 Tax=Microbacterium sp. SORGH_AS_0862 TaxID=3041789 RepID=UPI0027929CFC|nr:HtaA domain-containing protein [Microbacterium sp. SORGH_AS_0862]MDQ1205391.1 opacity protein-like surface antigen [Microbacterium sp. SORGH_AS_0862]
MRVRLASFAVSVLATSLLGVAAPAVAAETATTAAAAPGACTVTGGQLTWGFKESFRSYISGTIANGAWEPIDGASYATPNFSWPAVGGEIDPEAGTGSVAFGGGVRFTGHSGLLDTTIANPTLELTGAAAQLRLDVTGLSMDDALAGATENVQTATQVAFVDLDVASVPVAVGETSLTGTAVPTAITADGYAQFGSYETGTAFDPLTFDVQLDCSAAEPEATAEPEPEMTTTAAETQDETDAVDLTWLWAVGGGLVVAAGVTTTVIVVRRRSGGGAR